jgi:hypothetical protein
VPQFIDRSWPGKGISPVVHSAIMAERQATPAIILMVGPMEILVPVLKDPARGNNEAEAEAFSGMK